MSNDDVVLDLHPQGSLEIDCVENGPIRTNTYFVVSGDEAVVIDPAHDGVELARHFAQAHPHVHIRALIATHAHADHIGGVAGMRRVLGADVPFCISEKDAAFIPAALESMRELWGIHTEDPGAPDRLLREGDELCVGTARLQVIETPGHTKGGIVLFSAAQAGNVAFVGDTLFPGSHGRTDLEGGDEAEIQKSLAKMARVLPQDTVCLIGHGPITTIADELVSNPFMCHI
ncbi:MBL fold metallo-hydrolase [Collinsella sp. AGMB00827]|uniref:MBL fold metallo-hydrolase n=1 Tax=Collinsella ureilytica TaxID=2869515 RepID=A0ABS7ML68_9ACTN|nr:MBL fold metallo-hydrolase [Collinsella urealyticum]